MPSTEKTRSIRERANALLAQHRADQDRRDALPAAVCAACGGIVPAGRGTLKGANTWSNPDALSWSQIDKERRKIGLPALFAWRRRHDGCADSAGMVEQLTGDVLSPALAGLALTRLSTPILVQNRSRTPNEADTAHRDVKPRPWSHLTDADRAALPRAVNAVRAQVELRRCREGACAWCGVSHSIGWRKGPETWADGSEAPLCRACAEVWDRRGQPKDDRGRRACALEVLSGANSLESDGLGIRTFADLAGDNHRGHAQPWQYAPAALEALKERARLTWPTSLPGALRDEYLPRAVREQRDRYAAALNAQRAEEEAREQEAARAAGWPV